MNDADLQAALAYWQDRLRLRDWHITAKHVHAMDLEGSLGETSHYFASRSARIRIVPQDQWTDDRTARFDGEDEESAIVHELLHCVFSGFRPDDWNSEQGELQHQAINAIAAALIEEHRRTA